MPLPKPPARKPPCSPPPISSPRPRRDTDKRTLQAGSRRRAWLRRPSLDLFDSRVAATPSWRPRRSADRPPRRAAPRRAPRHSARAAQAARRRPGQAVRARHQRADARPDVAVPLRRARHLPADDHARGARRPQEGHERGRAQRAPGQPRPRRAGRLHRCQAQHRRRRPASPLSKTGHREAARQAVLPDHAARRQAARRPAAGQGRQPDPGRRAGAARAAAAAATWCWCPRTSTCASRRARWACRPRTTSTTRRWTTATCSTPACCRCRPTSGSAMARPWRAGSRAATPTTASAGPLVPVLLINQFVYLETPGRRAAVRARHRDHRQDRGAEDAARLHATRRTRSGA